MADINQYLTFKLADEIYAINVSSIKEVLGVPKITIVPRMPAFMSGVINLRGNVVPVLDLKMKFGLGQTLCTLDTSIIVTEIKDIFKDDESECFTVGIFSDMVQKVIDIDSSMIEPPPKIGSSINTEFIIGMGRINSEFVIILNISRILSGDDLLVSTAEGSVIDE